MIEHRHNRTPDRKGRSLLFKQTRPELKLMFRTKKRVYFARNMRFFAFRRFQIAFCEALDRT